MKASRVKHIQLVPIDDLGILMVMICDTGIVKNSIYKPEEPISLGQLNLISHFLYHNFRGFSIDGILVDWDYGVVYGLGVRGVSGVVWGGGVGGWVGGVGCGGGCGGVGGGG